MDPFGNKWIWTVGY